MGRIFIIIFLLFLLFNFPKETLALSSNFVTVVNPVRGQDYWDLQGQKPEDSVREQMLVVKNLKINPTWLLRFDALDNNNIVSSLKQEALHEKGLFLEITPSWTDKAKVTYHQTAVWHFAGSIFLTGYSQDDREKLIDAAFEEFKTKFGYYPVSVGAWWIDSYSLNYMQEKYGVTGALIVADQYTTDNYQIWGQYFGTPYYPYNKNTLMPAQTTDEKINTVVMQWAGRDPINGYGDGVQESTYSVQANDYLDFHHLGTDYFEKLIDLYTNQKLNSFNQVVVGLENSYSWQKYGPEYRNQMDLLVKKRTAGQVNLSTMRDFANWYKNNFTGVSPAHLIVSDDPLGSGKKSVWFMDPYFRVGWFYNNDGSVFRDIRQYVMGTEEPCYSQICEKLNFATNATRVLDDVSFKQKYIIDQGKISEFEVLKNGDKIALSYKNQAGNPRLIEFLPRDLSIDGKVTTIDEFILRAVSLGQTTIPKVDSVDLSLFNKLKFSYFDLFISSVKFLVFLIIALIIPGYLLISKLRIENLALRIFLSITIGFAALTLVSFIAGYLKSFWLVYIFLLVNLGIFGIQLLKLQRIQLPKLYIFDAILLLVVLGGTFFQTLAVIRSGWVYPFGVGYLGPVGHDGVWHQALINQLVQGVPPLNPGFAGANLVNYHYFFDLLVAVTAKLFSIPVLDLLYRFYPILFSLLLGIGAYYLTVLLFKNKFIGLLAVYLTYFGSSFGWVVDVIKRHEIGGESAFWANQPVSFNLNPPFAISLLMIIAGLILLQWFMSRKGSLMAVLMPLILLWGTLIEFKVYAGVIVLGALGVLTLQGIFQRDFSYLKILIPSGLLSGIVFLPQNSQSGQLLVFSPFWFIHTMIDFPDRVGWLRLSMGREAYWARGEWWKFFLAEGLGLAIFILGNLGTRLLGFFLVVRRNWGTTIKNIITEPSIHSLLVWMGLISFLLPLLFIQKGNNWNTIQFLYYFLFLFSIWGAVALGRIYYALPKLVGGILIIFILIITPISSFATFKNGFYPTPPSRVPLEELEALNFLKTQPNGVVLTYPYNKDTDSSNLKLERNLTIPYPLFAYESTAYVSAFSEKPTYLEDEVQQDILQMDYKKRLVASNDFFGSGDPEFSKNFLKLNNVRYIYLPRIFNKSINEDKLNLKHIFENKYVDIYESLN